MNRALLLGAALLLAACGEESSLKSGGAEGLSDTRSDDADFVYRGLRLDLVPTELPASAERVTLLPQSVRLPTLTGGEPYDAGTLALADPLEIAEAVTAFDRAELLPAASLPGEDERVGIPATVRVVETGTLHDYRAVSDDAGDLTLFVMPGDAYTVTVVPDDPRHPLTSFPWRSDDPLDLDLPAAASVYGRVLVGDVGLADATVQLVSADGVRSSPAITDRNGFYELAAAPGTYTVECLGRSFGEEPQLAVLDVVHADVPSRVDLDYPALSDVLVDARVVDAEGEPLEGITVRLVSQTLDGLGGRPASYTTDKLTDEAGGILARVPAGTYTVSALPPARNAGARHTPVVLDDVDVSTDTDLGVLALAPAVEVEGTVADGGQSRLDGAVVACREIGYGGRSWSTVTNEEGRFGLQLPQIPVTCAVSPPADRTDLALTRLTFDPADVRDPTLSLRSGLPIQGVVVRDDEPEALVVVEVRDEAGELLGSALTDEDGAWQIQLPRP